MVKLNLKYFVLNKLSKIIGVVLLLLFTSTQVLPNIIQIGGVIPENTIWTSNDTVIVYADLIVPVGLTLIIEGGANIRLNINTGIVIDEGNLLVLGTLIDSVFFVPNHSVPGLTWKWNGIIIKHANIENQSKIIYAHVADAETGVRIEESHSVEISSTTISNSQNLGIQFINSSSCFVADCRLENNYDGIEIIATYLGGSSNNIIYNCLLRNQNNNIYIYSEDGGIYKNNLIVGNIIDSGINGIWVDNNGGSSNSNNVIEKNIFINNGFDVGYGLFLVHDSTTIRNNIFWKNSVAVYSGSGADNCRFINNSFYQNDWAIAIGPGSKANQYANNTFTLNKTEVFGIKETDGVVFSNNNLMYTNDLENIVVNNTSSDLLIDENYWGTTDTILINKLIYDKNDNPNLGELIYHPFLYNIDTSNPISPPNKVIKQLINNLVQVTWLSNKEADLKGYRVYYDGFIDYSFTENFELGLDTTFTFPNDISIYSDIAVTSFDSAIVHADAQVLGNESPFSFAAIYPYSGPDTIICKHLEELNIVHSNIPMAYNSLFWKTSGDGVFSNSTIQSPTYFPGFVDIQNGGAQLSLHVVVSNDTLVDEFYLSIIDDPIANAGNDTIVVAETEIYLNEANAENYDNVIWFTSGDGSFNNDTFVNPIYYPSLSDIQKGSVYLEMIAYSQCGYATDTIEITIEPYFSVEGKIWNNQQPVSVGVVVAFKQSNEGSRAIQIESALSDGSFKFEKLMTGNYYLYAVPDTNNVDFAVPGYYANKLRWQSAYLLPVDADVYDIDIYLPTIDFVLPSGDATISGNMIMPQNSKVNSDIYCAPWFESSGSDFCAGGLSNSTVFLFNETKTVLLDYTLTNQFGDFYFDQLPYGNYRVDAEKAGFTATASHIIRLTQEHKSEINVILEITQKKIGIHFDGEQELSIVTAVYPNPASTEINLALSSPLTLHSKIEIYDVYGNLVISFYITDIKDIPHVKLDVRKLSSGIYFGQIINTNVATHFSFVKR